MKVNIFLTLMAVATVGAAPPGYKYTGPAQPQVHRQSAQLSQPIGNFRPSPQIAASAPAQSSSGIFAAVQSLPLAQFNVGGSSSGGGSLGGGIGGGIDRQPQQSFAAPQAVAQPRPIPLQAPPPPPPPPPAPVALPPQQPQQVYLPPQQQQLVQQQHVSQQQQVQHQPQLQQLQQAPVQYQQQPEPAYSAPTEQFAAVPSIPQGHQQQVVQQQLGGFQQGQLAGGFQQGALSGGFQQQALQQQPSYQQPNYQAVQRPQTAIITKDIYIHSAPEDLDDGNSGPQGLDGPVRKNYRIVFIKAPSQNLRAAAAALKRAQAANEEKTVIYVLSKKPDLSEVQQQLQLAQSEQKPNKPEVYFIKYKTQEEALRAQQQIQAQYDALGGSTHVSDEGVAPLSSVSSGSAILSLPIHPGGGASVGGGGGGVHVPAQTYGLKK